ncbi:hypothetical protein JQ628_27420 [Bradyrhizobium lablabi]|uniref:hypothetical protein n=1 Tax=Bradyrhizobium lablabi TaxID=722472 RepID=UPI001BA9C7D1|nr:hypothetical protein [Bradyrhizobium lablabi]MBR1125279.1 hypothetical protein [Bradyrhizobium lablabi]
MRFTGSLLSRVLIAAMFIVGSPVVTIGQDSTDTRREWGTLANGRTEFEVSDAASLPKTLAFALEQAGCPYKDEIEKEPVRFMRPEGIRIAIVLCRAGTVSYSHQVFDVSSVLKPRLLEFPILAHPGGFRATATPGWITWDKEAKVFQAETGSDISVAGLRHFYRIDPGLGRFVLVRVEYNPHTGNKNEWTTIWEASDWSFPGKPN